MSPAPTEGPLIDTFGRVADDLRVSVTDRCNFRCTYCMPAEGLNWLPKEQTLTFEEITRVVRVFVSLGTRSIKLTGGEPTVRADLPKLVAMLRAENPDLEMSMTTNGLILDRLAKPLAEAGLDRVTVSCDSLMRHRFEEMTRRDALDKVLAGLLAAEAAGLTPIKINCVMIGGQNEEEVVDFAGWARATGYEVRFIEYMPLDAEQAWERAKVVPPRRSWSPSIARFRCWPNTMGPIRQRPSASPTAPPGPWGSSPRSRSRSARPASVFGSPRRGSSGPASSPWRRWTSASRCVPARATTSWPS
jgi:GTP 3',8-cyclase